VHKKRTRHTTTTATKKDAPPRLSRDIPARRAHLFTLLPRLPSGSHRRFIKSSSSLASPLSVRPLSAARAQCQRLIRQPGRGEDLAKASGLPQSSSLHSRIGIGAPFHSLPRLCPFPTARALPRSSPSVPRESYLASPEPTYCGLPVLVGRRGVGLYVCACVSRWLFPLPPCIPRGLHYAALDGRALLPLHLTLPPLPLLLPLLPRREREDVASSFSRTLSHANLMECPN